MIKNYFPESEQRCPCCHIIKLAPGFLDSLNELREACGHELKANSMCRCALHNKAVGGKDGSYHLITHPWGCCAIDISTVGWSGAKKWAFIKLAMDRGFSVGFASSFIHLDKRHLHDKNWPKPVFFNY